MIIVRLKGGVGNQLFQYAFGLSLQDSYKKSLVYDVSRYKTDPSRHFELEPLNLPAASEADLSHFFNPSVLDKIKVRLNMPSRYAIVKERVEDEWSYSLDAFKIKAQGIYFDGYWQNQLYFEPYFEHIRNKLLGLQLPNPLATVAVDKITVAVHVRRGDYLTPQFANVYASLTLDYYTSAMAAIKSKVKDPVFYIFSDDIQWCQRHIVGEGIVLVEPQQRPLHDLILMSGMSHHIIANSTFSLWAAWLNPNRDKVVIWPKHWFKDHDRNIRVGNLIPKDWIRM